MENGISKHWTPEKEAWGQRLIDSSPTFVSRHLMTTIRDMLKYDGRAREGKRAQAQARLRFATATDKDLEELARIYVHFFGKKNAGNQAEQEAKQLEQFKEQRGQVRERGFSRSDLASV